MCRTCLRIKGSDVSGFMDCMNSSSSSVRFSSSSLTMSTSDNYLIKVKEIRNLKQYKLYNCVNQLISL